MSTDKTLIDPIKTVRPTIYAYTIPSNIELKGYVKIGYTGRDVDTRIKEQTHTSGATVEKLWEKKACTTDGEYFTDHPLHRWILNRGHNDEPPVTRKPKTEWFYFNGSMGRAEKYTDEFISKIVNLKDEEKLDYILRDSQEQAVLQALNYFNSGKQPSRFLWNAKPRFGKTLATYDLMKQLDVEKVLVVTNRPSISDSWYIDYHNYISHNTEYKFVMNDDRTASSSFPLALTRQGFLNLMVKNDNAKMIAFFSLQDLKGAKWAGGEFKKLSWVHDLNWDLIVIDESHEGVDTFRSDRLFSQLKTRYTLSLSGTPFKALASGEYIPEQIFNWTYADEQNAKSKGDTTLCNNQYDEMPELRLFTYRLSEMMGKKILELSTEDDLFTFDLNELFSTNKSGDFIYEKEVSTFIGNLSHGDYPYAHDYKLNHTLWLLDRVASANALAELLRNHEVFKEYKIVVAAGDGEITRDTYDDEIKSNLEKVKYAIRHNDKTITLSVGQLTTGVTIPEWTGIFILNNTVSSAQYMQTAFRAQNPWTFDENGERKSKTNAYVFDFAPERTLEIYRDFAVSLSGSNIGSVKDKIVEMLNFFPVISRDVNGQMKELDAESILSLPNKIKTEEVVCRGFMSNFLFANIDRIFGAPKVVIDILEQLPAEKQRRMVSEDIKVNDFYKDKDGSPASNPDKVAKTVDKVLGKPEFIVKFDVAVVKKLDDLEKLAPNVTKTIDTVSDGLKTTYGVTTKQKEDIKKKIADQVVETYNQVWSEGNNQISIVREDFDYQIKQANSISEKRELETKKEEVITETREKVELLLTKAIEKTIVDVTTSAVETQENRVEKSKKDETESMVRDHLRGFARTIPVFLMAYGNRSTTLTNIDEHTPDEVFQEIAGISESQFRFLRDGGDYTDEDGEIKHFDGGLFDEVIFNASIGEFFNKRDEVADYLSGKEGLDIFAYIPPQKTNQIFTSRRVVKHMVDLLEYVEPDIFADSEKKYIDLYTKSGMYITEIVKRLYQGLKNQIPDNKLRIKHILENQVYAIAPSNIIYNMVINFVFGIADDASKMNFVECDLTPIAESGIVIDKIRELFGDDDLKFDVVIGNPPYQESDGGAQASARPIYQKFVRAAKELNPRYIDMVTPSRWYVGGKGLDDYRDEMLNDPHFRELHDWLTPDDIFPNTNIRGGVSYFLLDSEYDNKENLVHVVTYEDNKIKNDCQRPLKIEGLDVLIRDSWAVQILEKVKHKSTDKTIMDYTSPRKPFGFGTTFKNNDEFNLSSAGMTEPIKCYANAVVGYVERVNIKTHQEWADGWKIFTSRANNIGTELPDDNLNTIIGEPQTVCTETYIVIGADLGLDRESVNNLSKYLKTKFSRYLHGLAKASQDAARSTYRFIPLQDFTYNSDINWELSSTEIDRQLYEKYRFTDEEGSYIDSKIKAM